MNIDSAWWAHALIGSGIASGITAAVLVTVLIVAPYGFFSDYPQDIQDAAEPPTKKQRRAGLIGGIVFMAVMIVTLSSVLITWSRSVGGAGYWELALMGLVATVMFSLVDLVIVDWLVICTIRPKAILLPGTEDCIGWRDRGFHFRALMQPKALAVQPIGGLVLGGIAWLLT